MDLLILLLGAFLLAIALWLLVRKGFLLIKVQGSSMSPALSPGDRIVVLRRKSASRLRTGQIVIVTPPATWTDLQNPSGNQVPGYLVKRVVALAGEMYEDEDHPAVAKSQGTKRTKKQWSIEAGHVFVRGDNGPLSLDSRVWGPLPLHNVHGVMVRKLGR